MLIVIAFDDDHGDARFHKFAQHKHGVVSRLRIDVATVEEVAGDDDEIDVTANRVALDDLLPRAKKIARAVRQIVPLDAQMNVGDV